MAEGVATPRPLSTVERAYELARNGPATSVDDIQRQLTRERYAAVAQHLSGPTIRKQLRQLCQNRLAAARVVVTDAPAEG